MCSCLCVFWCVGVCVCVCFESPWACLLVCIFVCECAGVCVNVFVYACARLCVCLRHFRFPQAFSQNLQWMYRGHVTTCPRCWHAAFPQVFSHPLVNGPFLAVSSRVNRLCLARIRFPHGEARWSSRPTVRVALPYFDFDNCHLAQFGSPKYYRPARSRELEKTR